MDGDFKQALVHIFQRGSGKQCKDEAVLYQQAHVQPLGSSAYI